MYVCMYVTLYMTFMIQAHWFRVHLESLPSRAERCRFTAFLQHGCMTADVYDGDSLILLGVARIPLAVSEPPYELGIIEMDHLMSLAGFHRERGNSPFTIGKFC